MSMAAIAAIAAAISAQPIPAPNAAIAWEVVIEDPTGRILLDPASISRDGDMVRFLVKIEEDDPQPGAGAVMMMRHIIDCAGRRTGYLGGAMYTAEGRQIAARETRLEDVAFEPIEPDSAPDLYHRRLCAGGPPAR